MDLLDKASNNISDILKINYKIKKETKVLIVSDSDSKLSILLTEASKRSCITLDNNFKVFNFNLISFENIEKYINSLSKGDIIIMIQSTSFRVSKYRWRNELCNQGFKVVEFGHLSKIKENEMGRFITSLTLDFNFYEKISNKLISLINSSNSIKIISSDNSVIEYSGKMDKCLRNIGALWEQTNWTTRFPIGEVITESLDLTTLNGEALIYGFPNIQKQETVFTKPFKCKIKNGLLISHEGNKEFTQIIEMIKTENTNGDVFVRELGLGLNRHIRRTDLISEPLAYERQEGLHFSLGMKHGMYQKKLWPKYGKKFHQRFHIDIFIDLKELYIDNTLVYTLKEGFGVLK